MPLTVVGVGSNLLVRDGGIKGVVLRLSAKGFGDVELVGENRIRAGAICPDKNVAAMALDNGIGGFPFFYGIPGSIGGALRMNAGANGVETNERVVEVGPSTARAISIRFPTPTWATATAIRRRPKDLIFTRRSSKAMRRTRQDPAEMDAVRHHRETVQPVKEKTGGSTFKNPEAIRPGR